MSCIHPRVHANGRCHASERPFSIEGIRSRFVTLVQQDPLMPQSFATAIDYVQNTPWPELSIYCMHNATARTQHTTHETDIRVRFADPSHTYVPLHSSSSYLLYSLRNLRPGAVSECPRNHGTISGTKSLPGSFSENPEKKKIYIWYTIVRSEPRVPCGAL